MPAYTNVVIGIQARTTSTRFPNKVNAKVVDQTVLQEVLSACEGVCVNLNRHSDRKRLQVKTALLIPTGDPLKDRYTDEIEVIEGPEHDVLARYVRLVDTLHPHFIVRITSDCPLVPQAVINRMITVATMNRYDYTNNVDERCRTAPDGFDCEILSDRLVRYLDANAKEPADREHVTTLIRKRAPDWAKCGMMIGTVDLSDLKWSVDNEADLDRVRTERIKAMNKRRLALEIYGNGNVHVF